jgi:hypothetical protein
MTANKRSIAGMVELTGAKPSRPSRPWFHVGAGLKRSEQGEKPILLT